jgi:glucan phosphoethanolaminetransferase (alkaline phosphatase superfamily)
MLELKIFYRTGVETFYCTNYNDMLDTISDEVSNDIIDDLLVYIEDIINLENNEDMNEQLYNKYLRRLKEQQYKEIILLHLDKLGLDYEINKVKRSE